MKSCERQNNNLKPFSYVNNILEDALAKSGWSPLERRQQPSRCNSQNSRSSMENLNVPLEDALAKSGWSPLERRQQPSRCNSQSSMENLNVPNFRGCWSPQQVNDQEAIKPQIKKSMAERRKELWSQKTPIKIPLQLKHKIEEDKADDAMWRGPRSIDLSICHCDQTIKCRMCNTNVESKCFHQVRVGNLIPYCSKCHSTCLIEESCY